MKVELSNEDLEYITKEVTKAIQDKVIKSAVQNGTFAAIEEQAKGCFEFWSRGKTFENEIRQAAKDKIESQSYSLVRAEIRSLLENLFRSEPALRKMVMEVMIEEAKHAISSLACISREGD